MPRLQRKLAVPFGGADSSRLANGFTLVELLVVIAIIVLLAALAVPAFNMRQGSGNITKAAYDLVAAIETARAYATANNTYVWVGFFEENGSKTSAAPAVSGTGRVIVSVVAAKDGLQGFDPGAPASATNRLDPARLLQVGPLVKLQNSHLASFADGSASGATFETRPAAGSAEARIGDANPPTATAFPFQYPVGNPAPTAQYVFSKTLQFNPRGESRINGTYAIQPVVEIGLQPTRGDMLDAKNQNVVAVQVTGIAGNTKLYRR